MTPADAPGRRQLLILLLSSMMILMGGCAVAPALPLIQAAFPDAGEAAVALIISVPSLAVAVFGFAVGWAADRWGKALTLKISLAIFALAGTSAVYLDSLGLILVGRFILGIGIAGISVASTALITEYWHGPQRVKIVGYQAAAMGLGIMVLEVGGGALAGISWRAPFLIYLLGAVILLGALLWIREPAREAPAAGPLPERQVPADWKRTVVLCYLTIGLMQFVCFMFPSKMSYYLEGLGVASVSLMTGLLLGFHGICNAVLCVLHPRLAGQLDRPTRLIAGFLLIAACDAVLFVTHSYLVAVLAMGLSGAGMGLIVPTAVNWLATTTTGRTSGRIMGGYSVVLNLAIFVASLCFTGMAAALGSYAAMFLSGGVLALAVAVFYLIYRPVYLRQHTE